MKHNADETMERCKNSIGCVSVSVSLALAGCAPPRMHLGEPIARPRPSIAQPPAGGNDFSVLSEPYWAKRSADRGDPRACFKVGMAYLNGVDVQSNAGQANRYLQRAADGNHLGALQTLALAHLPGGKFPQDNGRALSFLQRGVMASKTPDERDHFSGQASRLRAYMAELQAQADNRAQQKRAAASNATADLLIGLFMFAAGAAAIATAAGGTGSAAATVPNDSAAGAGQRKLDADLQKASEKLQERQERAREEQRETWERERRRVQDDERKLQVEEMERKARVAREVERLQREADRRRP